VPTAAHLLRWRWARKALALAVDDLGLVLAIVGATVQTTLQYVLPGLCYVRLVRHGQPLKRRLACAQLAVGVVFMPVSLYCALRAI
jgi:amino acid permease